MIGFVLNHNMAPFIGKTAEKQRIEVKNSEIPDTFIEMEWTITLSNEKKSDQAMLSQSLRQSQNFDANSSISKLTELNMNATEGKDAIAAKE